jgi:hypothetical protein
MYAADKSYNRLVNCIAIEYIDVVSRSEQKEQLEFTLSNDGKDLFTHTDKNMLFNASST